MHYLKANQIILQTMCAQSNSVYCCIFSVELGSDGGRGCICFGGDMSVAACLRAGRTTAWRRLAVSQSVLDAEARRLCLHGHGGGREPRVEAEQWRRRWGAALGGGRIGSVSGCHYG